MPEIFKDEPPVFVRVVTRGELLLFTSTLPKSMLYGTSCTVPDVSATAEFALLVVSVTEVATTETAVFAGRLAGAV